MMRILLFIFLGCAAIAPALGQEAREQQAIRQLCGCFLVDFRYAETFAPDTGYRFHPRYHTYGVELAYPEEVAPGKVVIQHLLAVDDTTIIKHWREDWTYQQTGRWLFDHDAVWKYTAASAGCVRGQWTQTVWEVDDGPRYQGSAAWTVVGGKYAWQSTTDAPLPRREYTHRNDYNVLERTNRIYATDSGWVHEQDNRKLVRMSDGADRELAEEKGYNVYKRIGEEHCAAAAAWWQTHRGFWKTVRAAWEASFAGANRVHLLRKANDKYLYEALDALEARAGARVSFEEVKAVLDKYIEKN